MKPIQFLIMGLVALGTSSVEAKTNYDISKMNGAWVGKRCILSSYNTGYVDVIDGGYVNKDEPVIIDFNRDAETFETTLVSSLYILKHVKDIDRGKQELPIYHSNSKTWIEAKTTPRGLVVRKITRSKGFSIFSVRTEVDIEGSVELRRSNSNPELVIKKTNYVQGKKHSAVECELVRN